MRSKVDEKNLFNTLNIRCALEGSLFGAIEGVLYQPVTSGILIRRMAREISGGFDPDVLEFEDFDLWTRLSLVGTWLYCSEPLWIHHREVMNEENVSQQCLNRPINAYRSLLVAHQRLRQIKNRNKSESALLGRAIGNFRCLTAALEIDNGNWTGLLGVMHSAIDWPSPRRIARAGAIILGWRPSEIRSLSSNLRSRRKR